MKKFSVIMILALGVGMAHAESATEKLLNTIAENSQYSNGGAYVSKYSVKKFKVATALKEIKKSTSDIMDCEFEQTVGRRQNIEKIASRVSVDDSETADQLEALRKKGMLKTIISSTWDGSSGDSEYCSIWRFEVYTNDGYVLYLDMDHTD